MNDTILYKEECYAINGALFEVYREMGCGFLEAVYQECLAKALVLRGIEFVAHRHLSYFINSSRLNRSTVPISSASIKSLSN